MNKYLKQTEKNNSANMKVQWNDWLLNKYFFTFLHINYKKKGRKENHAKNLILKSHKICNR